MKILIALTYYRPHISGLTIYVERLARGLARRGHQVTVLTSHFDRALPYREEMDGVTVIRQPVLFKLSKGVIQPGITVRALALMLKNDVVSVHLPQAEAGALSFLGRVVARKLVVLTYHCDLQLPPGLLNRVIDRLVYITNHIGARFAHRIVSYTEDYEMKIDVEGWEKHVLQGAAKLLSADTAPLLLIEFAEACAKNAGSTCQELYWQIKGY